MPATLAQFTTRSKGPAGGGDAPERAHRVGGVEREGAVAQPERRHRGERRLRAVGGDELAPAAQPLPRLGADERARLARPEHEHALTGADVARDEGRRAAHVERRQRQPAPGDRRGVAPTVRSRRG